MSGLGDLCKSLQFALVAKFKFNQYSQVLSTCAFPWFIMLKGKQTGRPKQRNCPLLLSFISQLLEKVCMVRHFNPLEISLIKITQNSESNSPWRTCTTYSRSGYGNWVRKDSTNLLVCYMLPHFQETHVGYTIYGKKNKQREFLENRKVNPLPCVTRVS